MYIDWNALYKSASRALFTNSVGIVRHGIIVNRKDLRKSPGIPTFMVARFERKCHFETKENVVFKVTSGIFDVRIIYPDKEGFCHFEHIGECVNIPSGATVELKVVSEGIYAGFYLTKNTGDTS